MSPRAGRVAQAVQHLPSKCEALSSTPVPLKKKIVEYVPQSSSIGNLIPNATVLGDGA
jgi:hypothetical protein